MLVTAPLYSAEEGGSHLSMYIAIVLLFTVVVIAAAITQIGYLQITRMRVKNDLRLFTVLEKPDCTAESNMNRFKRTKWRSRVLTG